RSLPRNELRALSERSPSRNPAQIPRGGQRLCRCLHMVECKAGLGAAVRAPLLQPGASRARGRPPAWAVSGMDPPGGRCAPRVPVSPPRGRVPCGQRGRSVRARSLGPAFPMLPDSAELIFAQGRVR
uniref:Uncharacterized protein n=1 Tax=Nothoprocta perdicaria TaxID=30464 RepID=A0A8C6YN23_NOTPE